MISKQAGEKPWRNVSRFDGGWEQRMRLGQKLVKIDPKFDKIDPKLDKIDQKIGQGRAESFALQSQKWL